MEQLIGLLGQLFHTLGPVVVVVVILAIFILPQAMRVIIPAMGNETISMLKTTSLLVIIAGHELMTNVQIVYSQTFQQIPLLIVASLWYLFFTTLMTIGQHYLEAYFGKGFGTGETEAAEKRAARRAARAHA